MTLGSFLPSLGLSSLICAMNEDGQMRIKSGFRLCLEQPGSPIEEFLEPVLEEGAAEGRQDREK